MLKPCDNLPVFFILFRTPFFVVSTGLYKRCSLAQQHLLLSRFLLFHVTWDSDCFMWILIDNLLSSKYSDVATRKHKNYMIAWQNMLVSVLRTRDAGESDGPKRTKLIDIIFYYLHHCP